MKKVIKKKIPLSALIILVFSMQNCVNGQDAITAKNIVERCRQSMNWQKSFSMKIHRVVIPTEKQIREEKLSSEKTYYFQIR